MPRRNEAPGKRTTRLSAKRCSATLALAVVALLLASTSNGLPIVSGRAEFEETRSSHVKDSVRSDTLIRAPSIMRELSNVAMPADSTTGTWTTVTGAQSRFEIELVDSPSDAISSAVEYAVRIVADAFPSAVPVRAQFKFPTTNTAQLGSGRAGTFYHLNNTFYQSGAYKSITGLDPAQNQTGSRAYYDVLVEIYDASNSNKWHIVTSGSIPFNKFDLVTVVIHETIHALFFTGLLTYDENSKIAGWQDGNIAALDQYLSTSSGCAIHGFLGNDATQNEDVAKAVTSGDLWFNVESSSTSGSESDNDPTLPLYAPESFTSLSSVYHFNVDVVGSIIVGANALMQPAISAGFQQHSIDEPTRKIMQAVLERLPPPPKCAVGSYEEHFETAATVAGIPAAAFWVIISCFIAVFIGFMLALLVVCTRRQKQKSRSAKHVHRRRHQHPARI